MALQAVRPDVVREIMPAELLVAPAQIGKTSRHEHDRHHDNDAEEQAGEARDFGRQNSETAESRKAPTTGPSIDPGPPNTAMMIILTFKVMSKALTGSRKVIQ